MVSFYLTNVVLQSRRVQLKANVDKLNVEAVLTVEVDCVTLLQAEEHRPGGHLVAPVVVVSPKAGVEVGLLHHDAVLVQVDEAACVLRVVVGVKGHGDLVDPRHLAGEHTGGDVEAGEGGGRVGVLEGESVVLHNLVPPGVVIDPPLVLPGALVQVVLSLFSLLNLLNHLIPGPCLLLQDLDPLVEFFQGVEDVPRWSPLR